MSGSCHYVPVTPGTGTNNESWLDKPPLPVRPPQDERITTCGTNLQIHLSPQHCLCQLSCALLVQAEPSAACGTGGSFNGSLPQAVGRAGRGSILSPSAPLVISSSSAASDSPPARLAPGIPMGGRCLERPIPIFIQSLIQIYAFSFL